MLVTDAGMVSGCFHTEYVKTMTERVVLGSALLEKILAYLHRLDLAFRGTDSCPQCSPAGLPVKGTVLLGAVSVGSYLFPHVILHSERRLRNTVLRPDITGRIGCILRQVIACQHFLHTRSLFSSSLGFLGSKGGMCLLQFGAPGLGSLTVGDSLIL